MIRYNRNLFALLFLLLLELLIIQLQVRGFTTTTFLTFKITARCQETSNIKPPLSKLWGSSAIKNGAIDQSLVSQWQQQPQQPTSSRREAWIQAFKTTMAIVVGSTTTGGSVSPARAASQARVTVWPGLEYLEPVYELQLSVAALSKSVPDPSKWPYLQQRLEKFFGGGLFSERNYYAGLGVQYMNQVQYDKNELPEYVKLDKEERFEAMERALQGLESLKAHLAAKADDVDATKAVLRSDVDQVQVNLNRWFDLVPKQDLDKVSHLYVAVRGADVDRNGRIDDQELATLSEEDQAVWKKRIDLVGG